MEKKCLGCNNIIFSTGKKPSLFKKQKYCSKKCGLVYRNKTNNPMRDPLVLNRISDKNSKLWLGENAGYFQKHKWIRSQGINRDFCLHCGIKGEYRKDNKWTIEFCNISGNYKRNISDWICLCRKCHRKFDFNKLKYTHTNCIDCNSEIKTKFAGYVSYCKTCNIKKSRLRSRLKMRETRGYSGRKYKLKEI